MQPEEKINILLVDDNPKNLVALEAMLEGLGENLVKANSGREALKHVLEEEFAVILLDVRMPDMDGFEAASLIRQRAKSQRTPIIFTTAFSKDDKHALTGYSLGAVDYLFKPIVPEILKAKVSVFIDLFKKTIQVKQTTEAEALAKVRVDELERELKSLERLSSHGKVSVTAEAFGLKSLREGAPDKFNEMVQHYNDLMDLALEQRSFKVEHNISNKLKALSEEMGFLRAGPRDVVEIHGTALKQKSSDTTPQKFQIYAEEGRVMVLELMGYLVSFYRSYSAGVGSAAPREGKKKNSNS